MKRRRWLVGLLACSLMLLTGCISLDSDDFYALPKRSQQYNDLQSAVERAMGSGEYSAPVSGSNRQAVQQEDLDGDGKKEALVFCKQMSAEHPLKVLILKQTADSYRLISTIEGDGTAFDSVQYAQIDGLPGMELLLSRRIGEQVQQHLTVYQLTDGTVTELMSSRYSASAVTDLDADGLSDVFILLSNADGPTGYADLYRYRDGAMQKDAEASLSGSAESVKRILTGSVAEGVPAVYVASAFDESHLITDVFALRGDVFTNISQNAESGQSSETVRNYYVYSSDIDNDGVIEIPGTVPLAELPADDSSAGQYRIVWYNLNVDGVRSDKMSTYHNFAEGWFFYLPDAWCQSLAVSKVPMGDRQSGTRFSFVSEDGSVKPLLTVAAFTGEDAAQRIREAGFLPLANRGEVSYGALIAEGTDLTEEDLKARFSFIAPDLLPETN